MFIVIRKRVGAFAASDAIAADMLWLHRCLLANAPIIARLGMRDAVDGRLDGAIGIGATSATAIAHASNGQRAFGRIAKRIGKRPV